MNGFYHEVKCENCGEKLEADDDGTGTFRCINCTWAVDKSIEEKIRMQ